MPGNVLHQVSVDSVSFIHSGVFFISPFIFSFPAPSCTLPFAPESSTELGNWEFDLLSAAQNNTQLVKYTSANSPVSDLILVSQLWKTSYKAGGKPFTVNVKHKSDARWRTIARFAFSQLIK